MLAADKPDSILSMMKSYPQDDASIRMGRDKWLENLLARGKIERRLGEKSRGEIRR